MTCDCGLIWEINDPNPPACPPVKIFKTPETEHLPSGTIFRPKYEPTRHPDYEALHRTLGLAYDQAAVGKGRQRHAKGQPFNKQPIMEIGRMVGIGYPLGQAMKKAQEASGMVSRGERAAAKAELLGAINYLAACHLLIEESDE